MRKFFLPLALVAAPLSAQTGTQVVPQLVMDKAGTARTISVRDPVANANRPIGTIDTNGFNSSASTTKIAGTQSIALPNGAAGNVTPLLSSFVMEASVPASQYTKSHAAEVLTLTSNVGFNAPNYGQGGAATANNQVTSYRSFIANPGSSDAWVDNTLLHHETNDPINTHGLEMDYDMFSTNKYSISPSDLGHGVKADGSTFEGKAAFGISVTGFSPYGGIATAGLNVSSASGKLFQYGYTTGFGINIAAYQDGSDAPNSYLDRGPHEVGINMEGGGYSTGIVIALPWQRSITSLDSTGTRRTMMVLGANNRLQIGDPGIAAIASFAPIIYSPLATPASSSTACTAGDQEHDQNYIYVCTATNHWRRSALSDF